MPAANELIAHDRSVEQVRQAIGADGLIYQDLQDLIDCVRESGPTLDAFETSCFDGTYITGDVDKDYLEKLQTLRADANKNPVDDEEMVDVGMQLWALPV